MDIHNFDTVSPIVELLCKYVQQQPISAEEQERLNHWLEESSDNRELFSRLNDEEILVSDILKMHQTDTVAEWDKYSQQLQKARSKQNWFFWRNVAAILLLTIGIAGTWLYLHVNPTQIVMQSDFGEDILPGSNKAELVLSSGNKITLRADQQGIISQQNGFSYENGERLTDANESEQYATLITPYGGQYKITLPDGTTVLLNAASKLKYPLHFSAEERVVELEGEAFFVVNEQRTPSLDKVPFRVVTAGQIVEVLGTQFNVRAYGDEDEMKTTLAKGKVKISSQGGGHSIFLEPGEQGLLKDNILTKSPTDVETDIAWKNGEFAFHSASLKSVMRNISRWYDVEVVYEDETVSQRKFSGSVSRFDRVSTVLNILHQTGDVNFEIKGKKILVKR